MAAIARQLKVVGEVETDPVIIKVAFATTSKDSVNQHFGTAQCLMIYGVGLHSYQLITAGEFNDDADRSAVNAGTGANANSGVEESDKLDARLQFIQGCAAVYSRACGASAIRRLVAQGVQPVRVTGEYSVPELLEALQEELRAGPSAWLAKAVKRQQYMGKAAGHMGTNPLDFETQDD